MDVTITRLIQCIDKEISNVNLEKQPISDICYESMMTVLDHLSKKDTSLISITNKMQLKHDECIRIHRNRPTEITQHNLNMLQMICLSFEMSFLL